MDAPPRDPGLTLSLTWSARGAVRERSLALDPVLRAGALAALAAACYAAGRGGARDAARVPGPEVVVVERGGPVAAEREGFAPGQAVGDADDKITPLNVRDPASLVIPPNVPPAAKAKDEDPHPRAKVYPEPDPKKKPDLRF